jgi:hypothetical protein
MCCLERWLSSHEHGGAHAIVRGDGDVVWPDADRSFFTCTGADSLTRLVSVSAMLGTATRSSGAVTTRWICRSGSARIESERIIGRRTVSAKPSAMLWRWWSPRMVVCASSAGMTRASHIGSRSRRGHRKDDLQSGDVRREIQLSPQLSL